MECAFKKLWLIFNINKFKLYIFLILFVLIYVLMYIYYDYFLHEPNIVPASKTIKKDCITVYKNEIQMLMNLPNLNLEKLSKIKTENNPKFKNQQTCQQICQNLPLIPKHEQMKYDQVGNIIFKESNLIQVINNNPISVKGGGWMFKNISDCNKVEPDGVAIVTVIRDRWKQLENVLSTLIPLLQRQKLCYRIFVIEQFGKELFNRGMMFNVGFLEAIDRFNFKCVVFHDTDLVPINDLNPYGCDKTTMKNVVHLGVGLDVRKFKLNYPTLIGGVLKMSNLHFVKINGHSNLYWGWGQEDDDLERRIKAKNIRYIQMSPLIARYKAMAHKPQFKKGNPRKVHLRLLKTAKNRIEFDGLSSLKYKVLKVYNHNLFTHILVDLGSKPKMYECGHTT